MPSSLSHILLPDVSCSVEDFSDSNSASKDGKVKGRSIPRGIVLRAELQFECKFLIFFPGKSFDIG